MTDLWRLDATAQAALVRDGELSALELVDAAIARIEALEPELHALSSHDFDAARERARGELGGPLAGVPFLAKDLLGVPGLPHRFGSRLFAQQVANEHSPYSAALDAAGLNVLGKTTTSELGLMGSTETLLEGATHNPWDLSLSAAGSSGGSAAAVAARLVPMAHASDGGGSIRIPAGVNGVFGLKPSGERMRTSGPGDMNGLVIDHCVSVSVRDSALLLSLTERDDGPLTPVGFVDGPVPRRIRIGAYHQTLMGAEPSAANREAFEKTVALCESLGHEVVVTDPPPIAGPDVSRAFFTMAGFQLTQLSAMVAPMLGRPPGPDELEPLTLALMAWFAEQPADAFEKAMATLTTAAAAMTDYLAEVDVTLCPTIPVDPYPLGSLTPTMSREAFLERTEALAGYTPIHNFAKAPAMSVPLFQSAAGLPVGSHFAASPGAEATLLSLAYELEAAAPWADRLPPLIAD